MSEVMQKLSAKVYWDRDSPDMDLSLALRGLEWLSRLCPDVEMIEESRSTSILCGNKVNANILAVPKTKLDADLNFVLTRKRIISNAESWAMIDERVPSGMNITLGIALMIGRVNSKRLAIVDVGRSGVTDQVIVHEAAHLMGFKNEGDATDNMHCSVGDCLMYHSDIDIQQYRFCEPCDDQIPHNAHALREAKFGKYALAPNAIFDPTRF